MESPSQTHDATAGHPTFEGIDHVHLYVTDKQQALAWYGSVLGFRPVEALRFWDTGRGPLVIEDAAGTVHLALFTREDQPPSTALAFKTSGEGFLRWQQHLAEQDLELRVADHEVSYSLYFHDPFGNMHEITTDEHSYIAKNIAK